MSFLGMVTIVFWLLGCVEVIPEMSALWPLALVAAVTGIASTVAFVLRWKLARFVMSLASMVALSLMHPFMAISMVAGLLWALSLKLKAWAERESLGDLYGHLD